MIESVKRKKKVNREVVEVFGSMQSRGSSKRQKTS